MNIAFLYAGQGSQCPGMGKDLYENEPLFAQVIDHAEPGFDLKEIMFEADADTLAQTQYTQPALAAFAAGVTNILFSHGIRPSYVAGLSLGEYSALYASGVLDAKTLIRLTAFRGRAMQEAAEQTDGVMSAVLGLTSDQVEAVCEQARAQGAVEVANYNTAAQTVIGGTREGVEAAEKLAKEAGAKRCMRLAVSSAFHTSFMKPAAKELESYLRQVEFCPMQIPVIENTIAAPIPSYDMIPELLIKQVQTGVRMKQSIEYMAENGVDTFIEIGPGKVLSGFVKKTVKGAQTYAISDCDSLAEVVQWGRI